MGRFFRRGGWLLKKGERFLRTLCQCGDFKEFAPPPPPTLSVSPDFWGILRERNISPQFFCPKVFCTPLGHGRPRVRDMDVHTHMLVFPRFRGPALSFWQTSAPMTPDVRGISGSKTFCLNCFFFVPALSGVPEKKSGKISKKLLEGSSRVTKCCSF